ncbi:hypothetical protein DWU98_16085 [Dyella monticola]|uniref:Uncharacterized protein n=1 Tax=Dyella monticola TaxID=1927958 RepID=A0A370WV94_9GAMM|nr:hypothetical protein [Dyella monticola]RDS79956.1 hypothetical protein DWU98_16085 [Dyella monticola]
MANSDGEGSRKRSASHFQPLGTKTSPKSTSSSKKDEEKHAPPPKRAKGPEPPSSLGSTHTPPSRPRSERAQVIKQKKMGELQKRANALGKTSIDPATDITPLLMKPLDPGKDDRGYVSTETRREIERHMESTAKPFPSLEKSNIPPEALEMRKEANNQGKTTLQLTTRGPGDRYRSGEDLTFTSSGSSGGGRTGNDTPRPRSPPPKQGLTTDGRYEHTHQSPFRFTGLPGTTVHAPTQANQVADTNIERYIEGRENAFMFRRDTPTHSHLTGVRVNKDGSGETKTVSYRRRPSRSPSPEPGRHDTPPKKGNV